MTLKELIDLKNILASDSISTTRLTTNSNFDKLRSGLIALIDTLQVNEGPNVVVDTVDADSIVANSFASPLPRNGVYNFRVNSSGEIFAKNLYANTGVNTPRLRLEPDTTTVAFQAGEIRWSGTDWVGWTGSTGTPINTWVSLSAGASGGVDNTMSNIGTGTGVYSSKVGVNFEMKSISGVSGIFIDNTTDPDTIIVGLNVSGLSGFSGFWGISGFSGLSGDSTSGISGFSGIGSIGVSGFSGESGFSGKGLSGFSGMVGVSGFSGFPGISGISGYSGKSGFSGVSGFSGISGFSGFSGFSGNTGAIGISGYSGEIGMSGYSGLSGATGAAGTVIGAAEDGSYLDGLFTDFTSATPIGTAVDRFNEVLLFLAPPSAPILSDWNELTLSLKVQGKLSFDTANPIATYLPADTAPSPIYVDQLFVSSGKRLGITQASGASALSGILNYQVTVGPGTPNPAYVAMSFGDADKGYLKIYVNGVELLAKRITLTSTTAAIDTTSSGAVTGLYVSASSPSLFPGGAPMTSFQNRTGTWKVFKSDLSNGYNYIEVIHEVTAFDLRTVAMHEVVLDDDVTTTAYSGESMFSPALTGTKNLSGIKFNTGGTVLYNVIIDNPYRNTYSSSSSAISHAGSSNAYGVLLTAAAQALPANFGNEASGVNVTSKVATFANNIRVINEIVTLTTSTLRTVQGTTTSPGGSLTGFLIDNVTLASTEVGMEYFNDETYRLNTNSTYDTILSVTTASNLWDSTQSLNDGSAGHITGLQVIGGELVYPGKHSSYPWNFQTTAINFSPVWNDGGTGGSARDYTGLAGNRTYIRRFKKLSPTSANFVMIINGTGGTFVPDTTPLTGNNIWVHVKGPTQTGFMDAYQDFVPASWLDGDGARDATNGAGRAYGVAWGLTLGTRNTANTGGLMLIRFTVGPAFTGDFTSITWNFS